MSRRKTEPPPPPLFSVKADFYASLDRFAHEAGMLADVVRQMVDLDPKLTGINDTTREILRERLKAFHTARFGDDA